jgi:hypothetical protein
VRQLTALDEQFLALEGPRHYGHVRARAKVATPKGGNSPAGSSAAKRDG